MQDWEVLAKNFNDISNDQIDDEELVWLEHYILDTGYLEEGLFCFIEISIENDNEIEADTKEQEPISNFKEEKKDKNNL